MSDVRDRMQETAQAIAAHLPPNTGFVLLAFDLNGKPGSKMEYISNGRREDVIQAMKEWIRNVEQRGYGKHLDK